MRNDDVIEQATRVLSRAWGNMATNDSLGRQRMLACALADAGLLARTLPDREEVIDLLKWNFWPFLSQDPVNPEHFWGQSADAVLELLKGQDQ